MRRRRADAVSARSENSGFGCRRGRARWWDPDRSRPGLRGHVDAVVVERSAGELPVDARREAAWRAHLELACEAHVAALGAVLDAIRAARHFTFSWPVIEAAAALVDRCPSSARSRDRTRSRIRSRIRWGVAVIVPAGVGMQARQRDSQCDREQRQPHEQPGEAGARGGGGCGSGWPRGQGGYDRRPGLGRGGMAFRPTAPARDRLRFRGTRESQRHSGRVTVSPCFRSRFSRFPALRGRDPRRCGRLRRADRRVLGRCRRSGRDSSRTAHRDARHPPTAAVRPRRRAPGRRQRHGAHGRPHQHPRGARARRLHGHDDRPRLVHRRHLRVAPVPRAARPVRAAARPA